MWRYDNRVRVDVRSPGHRLAREYFLTIVGRYLFKIFNLSFLPQVCWCPPVHWVCTLNIINEACKRDHNRRTHENERDENPAHSDDLGVGRSQNGSRASWGMHSVCRSHDGGAYGTSDCTCNPLEIFPIRVEVEQFVYDDSCQSREGLA